MGNYTHTAESFLEAGNAQNLAFVLTQMQDSRQPTYAHLHKLHLVLSSLFILFAAKLQNIFGWVSF